MHVLLVHGLWRTPLSFAGLARRLRRRGHVTEQFGYAAVAETYPGIVGRLAARLTRLARSGDYAVIGHSLGGLLLRAAVPRVDGPAPRHFVMLGTPNRPPRLARRLAGVAPARRPYRWMLGECGANLASPRFYAELPTPAPPYTIIAGTRGPRGRWSPFGNEPNDGIVAVSETLVHDADPIVTLPVRHPFMMNDVEVQRVLWQVLTGSDAAGG